MDNVEIVEYSKLVHSNPTHQETIVVNWCLGNTCNFSCSYCPEDLHNAKQPWPSLETAINFINKVKAVHQNKNIYVELTGGEVTLWKDLIQFSDFCRSNNIKIGIISNGSRSLEFWEKLIPKIDHVCLSFHAEKGNADHYYEVVKMASQTIRTHTNFMMHTEHFNKVLELAFRIKDIPNISMAIQPLVVDFGEVLYKYTPTQLKVIDQQHEMLVKHIKYDKSFEYYRGAMDMVNKDGVHKRISPQRLISLGGNNWKDWHCYAGVEQLIVNMDGDILRGWCSVGGKIGHISDEKLQLPTAPVLCNKSFCHCNFDIMSTKVKNA